MSMRSNITSRFEFRDPKSNKFCEITLKGNTVADLSPLAKLDGLNDLRYDEAEDDEDGQF